MSLTGRNQFICRVGDNVALCRDHYRLVLVVDSFPATRPGQFIQVSCRDLSEDYNPEHESTWHASGPLDVVGRELTSPLAFLRRPFSLAGRRARSDGKMELDVIYRAVGVGTDWLARLAPDDTVYILGPLGNHFEHPPTNQQAILVGGGVGIPPMLYLAESLAGRDVVAFCGAVTRDLLPLTILCDVSHVNTNDDHVEPHHDVAEFARHGVRSVITTDDGSYGHAGFVTQALERYLDQTASHPMIYTCGPEPMMKRVADIAQTRGIDCQIAVERAMACGMGTCQSCVIRVRKSDPAKPPLSGQNWCFRLACTDGPVFRGADLLW